MRRVALVIACGALLMGAKERKLDAPRPKPVAERVVTIDVKDAEVRDILESVQKQCAIKNLIVDPEVQGKGTFLFRKVPCRKALPIILRTMGLQQTIYGDSLLGVGTRIR